MNLPIEICQIIFNYHEQHENRAKRIFGYRAEDFSFISIGDPFDWVIAVVIGCEDVKIEVVNDKMMISKKGLVTYTDFKPDISPNMNPGMQKLALLKKSFDKCYDN